jgi:hypothetical protein
MLAFLEKKNGVNKCNTIIFDFTPKNLFKKKEGLGHPIAY